METTRYLNNLVTSGCSPKQALETLNSELGIKVKEYPEEGLYILNYDQIKSPKDNVIVQECRSLAITVNSFAVFRVISRSFNRFFNLGENECKANLDDFHKYSVYEKLDGSLVSLYYFKGEWHFRTKSLAFSEGELNGTGVTFKDIIDEALPEKLKSVIESTSSYHLDCNFTFIFELVSPLNRVVVRYSEPKLYLLAIVDSYTGRYTDFSDLSWLANLIGVDTPKRYTFESVHDCLETVKALPVSEEGYVLYDHNNVPVAKCKSPAYLAAHRLKGDGLTPKRICQLVLTNETDEYYSIFPEDKKYIEPYREAYGKLQFEVKATWLTVKGLKDNPKEFAKSVIELPTKHILFSMRVGLTYEEAWDRLTENAKITLISEYKERLDGKG